MNKSSETKPNIAIESHYDRRIDVTTHQIIHIKESELRGQPDEEIVIYKWPFKGEHKLSVTDIIWLNKIAIRLIKKEK